MKTEDLQRKFKTETGSSVDAKGAKELTTSGISGYGGFSDDIEEIIEDLGDNKEVIKKLKRMQEQLFDFESGADDFVNEFENKFPQFIDYVNWLEDQL